MRDSWMEGIEARALAAGGKVTKVRRDILAPAPSRHDPIAACSDRKGRHTLVIEGYAPPSLNEIMRGTQRVRRKVEKTTRATIETEAFRQGIAHATTARRVQIIVDWPKGRTTIDPDNIFKALGDALCHAKLLLSDRWCDVEWMPPIYRVGPLRTEVRFEDIERKVMAPAV